MELTEKNIETHQVLSGAQEITLSQAVETFLRLELQGKSPRTIHWYRDRLDKLLKYLGKDRLIVSIMDVDLIEFMAMLGEKTSRYGGNSSRPERAGGLSPFTIHGYIRTMRRFFRWLHKRDIIPANPALDLPVVKRPKIGKRGISDVDLDKMLELAKGHTRNYAILRFMADSGCRLGGVVALKRSDLNLSAKNPRLRRRAIVREKGDKDRSVFLTEETIKSLEAWLAERPEIPGMDEVFLASSPGQPPHPFKDSGIYHLVTRYAKLAGVTGPSSPHQFRHRFGRSMIQKGMSLAVVSQIMGHSSVQVTVEHYGQFAVDQLQDEYDKFMDGDGEGGKEGKE